MRGTPRYRRLCQSICALLTLALLMGSKCQGDIDSADITVINSTDDVVKLTLRLDGETLDYLSVGRGQVRTYQFPRSGSMLVDGDECTEYTFVARGPDGDVVARRSPPTCAGATWRIRSN
jgi:hypothetical protein